MARFGIFYCALLVVCISTTNAMRAPSANISESNLPESNLSQSKILESNKMDSNKLDSSSDSSTNPSAAKTKKPNTAHPHDVSAKKPTLIKIDSAFDEQSATNANAQKATSTTKTASALKKRTLKLIIYDCYRPQEAQEYAWSIMPDPRYVANPARGSMHTKGRAIDVSLADKNGAPLPMPSHFDAFGESAHPSYQCKKDEAHKCQNRDLLRMLMLESGFKGISSEWWHFWH